ncbi:MAG: hypothetical protein IK129_03655 [Deltaproteobacteria bacterium]|nr:hypothetical protein [Deltaproteobacteria bacterium]
MSRKNRNARRQANKPLNPHTVQMAMDTSPAADKNSAAVRMLDEKCGYEFTRLPSIMLESDTSYQRPIDLKRVQRIVENFDARLVNPLKVSEREGHYYVFDGAHTLAALKEIKKFDNFMVDVMLFHGLAYEDEAYLFALQRGESKEVATASRLKALMLSNDSRACDFRSRTESAGFRLSPSGRTAAKCTLGCVAKLWRIFEEDAGLYSETLSLLMSAWHGEAWSLNANIVGGVAMFIQAYRSEMNLARFLKHVGSADLGELNKYKDATAKNKDYSFAFAMYRLYNKVGGTGALTPYALYDFKI